MHIDTLTSADIKLINVTDHISLLFHRDSLKIFPIKNKAVIDILSCFIDKGINEVINKFSKPMWNNVEESILDSLNAPPHSIQYADSVNRDYRAIVLPIAAHCNLNCPYCFAQTNTGFNFKDFSDKDVDRILQFVIKEKNNQSPLSIIFFGGEPLLKFNLMEYTVNVCRTLYKDIPINFSITTNGTLLTPKILQFLKDNKFAILVSIDGPDNEYNLRRYKNGKKSIFKVLNNIKLLQQHGINVRLRATLVSSNPYIVDTYDFFEKLQLPFDIIFAYSSANKTHTEYTTYDAQTLKNINLQYNDLISYYINKIQKGDTLYLKNIENTSDIIRFRIIKHIPCSAGVNYYTFTAAGDIFPCPHLMNDPKTKIGDINSNINNNTSSISVVNVDNINKCNYCWAKYLCLGGCMAQKISAGFNNNSCMDINSCELEKMKWEFNLKLYYFITQLRPTYFAK